MSLLVTAFKLVLKGKMLKEGYDIVQEILPTPVKSEIARQAGDLGGKIQDGAADLLAKHAPGFSKKIARKAAPEKAQQNDALNDIQAQLAQLTQAMQKAQNVAPAEPVAPVAKKTTVRKPTKAG